MFRFSSSRSLIGSKRLFSSLSSDVLKEEVSKFNLATPIEAAVTPPSLWFHHPHFHQLDKSAIFNNCWLVGGRSDLVSGPGSYFADHLYEEPLLIVRDEEKQLRGFYNACRHHAAQLTQSSCENGCADKFVCPYHGWTYSTNGRLIKATRLRGIENFKAKNFGLVQFQVKKWGPKILIKFNQDAPDVEDPSAFTQVRDNIENDFGSFDVEKETGMTWIKQLSYDMKCNWKVFVDNYLDGGYHVEVLHKDLTTALNLDTYTLKVGDDYSIQRVRGKGDNDRLGKEAIYAFIFPNLMINRYGPWMDTNLVVPTGPNTSRVIYNYYLESKFLAQFNGNPEAQAKYVEESLKSSDQVQREDTYICESVQRGLQSMGYDIGRYAPKVETADHSFHVKLAQMYRNYLGI